MKKTCLLFLVIWIPSAAQAQGFSLAFDTGIAGSNYEKFLAPSVTLWWNPVWWFGPGIRVESLIGSDGCVSIAPVFVLRLWLLDLGVGYPFLVRFPDLVPPWGWFVWQYAGDPPVSAPVILAGLSIPIQLGPGRMTANVSLEFFPTPSPNPWVLSYMAGLVNTFKLNLGLGYVLPLAPAAR